MNVKLSPEKKIAFLAALADTGQITKACKAIDIARPTAYEWRALDPEFARAWDAAKDRSMDVLEDEAFRRAHDGDANVIPGKYGEIIRTEYSDTLLIFLLKGGKPNKYRERVDVRTGELKDKSEAELMAELETLRKQTDAISTEGLV